MMMNGQLIPPLDHAKIIQEMPYHIRLPTEERVAKNDERRAYSIFYNQQLENTLPPPKKRRQKVVFDIQLDLLVAIKSWNYREVENLLNEGALPDKANYDGVTHLHDAGIDNDPKMAYLLCSYGANVNAPDCELNTPLHIAAMCGNNEVVNVLLEFDANLLSVDIDGNIPLDVCEGEETKQLIWNEMIKKGFNEEYLEKFRSIPENKMLADLKAWHQEGHPLDARFEDGSTLLHIAAANGYYDVAVFLLRHLSPSLKDDDNWQPLHAAAHWDHVDIIELLCRYDGADLNAKTKNGEKPINLCQDRRTAAVLLQLEEDSQSKIKKKRHPYGARDSRARIRKKQLETSAATEASPFTRGVMRMHSMRDKKGVTLARLDEKKEGKALLQSWSGETDLEEEEKKEKTAEKKLKKKNIKKSGKKAVADETLDDSILTNTNENNTTKTSNNGENEHSLTNKKKKKRFRYCCIS